VFLATERPRAISALNIFEGRVAELALRDADALVTLDCSGDRILARITRRSLADLGIDIGTTAFAIVKAVAVDQGQTANTPLSTQVN
jgi:molybdate transport system ATP-binding protein